jgi:hypothetical protein
MNELIRSGGSHKEHRRLEGFPSLAHFISKDDDAAIFRTFDELGARNLLYLQSNLNELDTQLKRLDDEDAKNSAGNPGLRISAREYRSLKAAAHREKDLEAVEPQASPHHNSIVLNGEISRNYFSDRVELHNKIKHAMKEYRTWTIQALPGGHARNDLNRQSGEALIQEQQVRSFKPPAERSLSNFKRYFTRKDGNVLLGDDEDLLDKPRDLVALSPSEDDRLNSLIRYTCGYCFRVSAIKPQVSAQYITNTLLGSKTQATTRPRHFLLLGPSCATNCLYHSGYSEWHSARRCHGLLVTGV